MGFSVSGSFAVVAIASFMALGMFYSSAAIGFELVQEAQQDAHQDQLGRQNTAIELTEANWTTGGDCGLLNTCLVVEAENTGSTALAVTATDLLVDGHYIEEADYSESTVDGNESTDLWLPGETYHVQVNSTVINDFLDDGQAQPDRVKLVTEHGVADSGEVT